MWIKSRFIDWFLSWDLSTVVLFKCSVLNDFFNTLWYIFLILRDILTLVTCCGCKLVPVSDAARVLKAVDVESLYDLDGEEVNDELAQQLTDLTLLEQRTGPSSQLAVDGMFESCFSSTKVRFQMYFAD